MRRETIHTIDINAIELRALETADGTLSDAVGFTHKDDTLQVEPRPQKIKLDRPLKVSDYTDYIIHHTATGENLIARQGDDYFWLYTQPKGEEIWQLNKGHNKPIVSVGSGNIKAHTIGQLISFIGEQTFETLLFKDGNYQSQNQDFNGDETSTLLEPALDIRFRVTEDTHPLDSDYPNMILVGSDALPSKENVASVARATLKIEQRLGRLKGFRKLIYAYELFDGNTILNSQPILLGQASAVKRKKGSNLLSTPITYFVSDNNDLGLADILVLRNYSIDMGLENHNDNSDGYKYSLLGKIDGLFQQGNSLDNSLIYYANRGENFNALVVTSIANKLQYKIATPIKKGYKNIIKKLNIYLTQEVLGEDISNYFKRKPTKDIIEELEKNDMYYKVAELDFPTLQKSTSGWVDLDLKKDMPLFNLEAQPLLQVDNYSRQLRTANTSLVYNGRLHLAGLNTQLFKGFPLPYFYAQSGEGQHEVTLTRLFDGVDNQKRQMFNNLNYPMVEIAVDIETIDGTQRVVRTMEVPDAYLISKLKDTLLNSLNPIISYPDSKAKKLTITIQEQRKDGEYYQYKKEFDLKESKTQNYAYYIDPDLKPIDISDLKWISKPDKKTQAITLPLQSDKNSLIVSSVDNPFYFPAENSYKISSGEIIAIKANSEELGQGQIGYAPLFVFTNEGVFALAIDQTGEIAYTNARYILPDVPLSEESVLQIDGGFAVATSHGLKLISGRTSQNIDKQLEQDSRERDLLTHNSMKKELSLFLSSDKGVKLFNTLTNTNKEFRDYCKGAKIAYRYSDKALFVYNPQHDYYYQISPKGWLKQQGAISHTFNDHPLLYVVQGEEIFCYDEKRKDYSRECMFITKGIRLQRKDYKQISRAVARGYFVQTDDDYIQRLEPTKSEARPQLNRTLTFEETPVRNINYEVSLPPASILIDKSDFDPYANVKKIDIGIEAEAEITNAKKLSDKFEFTLKIYISQNDYNRLENTPEISYKLTADCKITRVGNMPYEALDKYNFVLSAETIKEYKVEEIRGFNINRGYVELVLTKELSVSSNISAKGDTVDIYITSQKVMPYRVTINADEQWGIAIDKTDKLLTLGDNAQIGSNILQQAGVLKDILSTHNKVENTLDQYINNFARHKDRSQISRVEYYEANFKDIESQVLDWSEFYIYLKGGAYNAPFTPIEEYITLQEGKYYQIKTHVNTTTNDFLYLQGTDESNTIDYSVLLDRVSSGYYERKPSVIISPEYSYMTQGENITLTDQDGDSIPPFLYAGESGRQKTQDILNYAETAQEAIEFDWNAPLTIYNGEYLKVSYPQGIPNITAKPLEVALRFYYSGYNIDHKLEYTPKELLEQCLIFVKTQLKPTQQTPLTIEQFINEFDGKADILPEVDLENFFVTLQEGKTYLKDLQGNEYAFIYQGAGRIRYSTLLNNIKEGYYKILDYNTQNPKYMGMYVFGSYDGVNYAVLGGVNKKEGKYRDIACEIRHNDCKFFKVVLFGNFAKGTIMECVELQGKPSKILNEKNR